MDDEFDATNLLWRGLMSVRSDAVQCGRIDYAGRSSGLRVGLFDEVDESSRSNTTQCLNSGKGRVIEVIGEPHYTVQLQVVI